MTKRVLQSIPRILLGIAASGLIALFVTQLLSGIGRNVGGFTGLILSILALAYALFANRFHRFIKETWQAGGRGRRTILGVGIVAACLVLTVLVETVFMCIYAHRDAPKSEQPPVLIVLGCQVNPDGPSLLLRERINTAYDYLTAHSDAVCIASGGQGTDEVMPEAQCIYQELVAMGIDPRRIYVEDRSTTTRENLAFCKEIMARENLGNTAVLVTNSWHELRAQLIAQDLGLEVGAEGADTPLWLLPAFYIRELYGILYQISIP